MDFDTFLVLMPISVALGAIFACITEIALAWREIKHGRHFE